ncbi:MAG: hypothetical protein ACR2PX_05440 [Endozoicomonas sp.]|uniref:hypothetical protein n=1 Tax=Endozoicomonas sp. TaxID=1892382 RepID=UPI003D9B73F1
MSLNELIRNFRCFLLSSWPQFVKVQKHLDWDENPYFFDIWLQANWELMVEFQALERDQYLTPYGYDNSAGCRHINKDKMATHRLVCKSSSNKNEESYFLCFSTKIGRGCQLSPPFDWVDVEGKVTGKRFSMPLKDVTFFLETIE